MASAPWPGDRSKTEQVAWAAAVIGVVVLAAAGFVAWSKPTVNGMPAYTPSCSWPLRVRGHVTSAQAGLIRCYLRALAHHNAAGLRAVAFNDTNRPVRITAKDFRHAADARSGVATATRGPAGEQANAYARDRVRRPRQGDRRHGRGQSLGDRLLAPGDRHARHPKGAASGPALALPGTQTGSPVGRPT
jgi:hypothetical protein